MQFRRRRDHTPDPRRGQLPGQAEPRRARLVGHRDRRRQLRQPRRQTLERRGQTAPRHRPARSVKTTPHDGPGMHIQADTRTLRKHRGLPQMWCRRGLSSPAIHVNLRESPRPRQVVGGHSYRLTDGRFTANHPGPEGLKSRDSAVPVACSSPKSHPCSRHPTAARTRVTNSVNPGGRSVRGTTRRVIGAVSGRAFGTADWAPGLIVSWHPRCPPDSGVPDAGRRASSRPRPSCCWSWRRRSVAAPPGHQGRGYERSRRRRLRRPGR